MSHLLTVFGVCEDNQGDVDVAILQALLKGGDVCTSVQNCNSLHCSLTLTWFVQKNVPLQKKNCSNASKFLLNVFCLPLCFPKKD